VEQWLTLPSAMGWVVYSHAVLQAADAARSRTTVSEEQATEFMSGPAFAARAGSASRALHESVSVTTRIPWHAAPHPRRR